MFMRSNKTIIAASQLLRLNKVIPIFDKTTVKFSFFSIPRLYSSNYIQGQLSKNNFRQYFYFIDYNGQLFLDDTRIKNFTTCFKDKLFIRNFFRRLCLNNTGLYENFPYIYLCGREVNYLRCEDLPVVFTTLVNMKLYYGNIEDEDLMVEFNPENIIVHPDNGRLYYPKTSVNELLAVNVNKLSFGLICSKLAALIAPSIIVDEEGIPVQILYDRTKYNIQRTFCDIFLQIR